MNQENLSELLKLTSVRKQILGNYAGAYSMGITRNPKNRKQLAISLRIEGEDVHYFPSSIPIDKEVISIIVSGQFISPTSVEC